MVIGVISVFITVCVLHCHLSNRKDHVPPWLSKMAICMNKLTCRNSKKYHIHSNNILDNTSESSSFETNHTPFEKHNKVYIDRNSKNSPKAQGTLLWRDVGNSIDVFCFRVVFFIVTLVSVLLLIRFGITYYHG